LNKIISIIALNCIAFSHISAQVIRRIDGSSVRGDSLAVHIQNLMNAAKVSGLGIVIYNDNKPVFLKTFGEANVPDHKFLSPSQVMYGASFSKAVFAYIVGQLVQEKVLDLDKPLVQYLNKSLPSYNISG
jgi:serine-type D-Ala-D-Ala carboxypeptidase/endopeptidase